MYSIIEKGGNMTYELSTAEKIEIIDQHIKSLSYSKYNLEMSILAEDAVAPVDQAKKDALTLQVSIVNDKINALVEEKALLSNG
jgi:hypothetical protein